MNQDERELEEARLVLEERALQAKELAIIAGSLRDEVRSSAEIVMKRTSVRWIGPMVAAAVIVGVLLSLILYVQASSRCTTPDSIICSIVAPANEATAESITGLISRTLQGVEYIGDGGTASAFLAGEADENSTTVLVREAAGYRIVHAVGPDTSGRPAVYRVGKLSKDAFPDQAEAFAHEADLVLKAGVPRIVTGQLDGGKSFVSRIYRIPGAVVFETAIQPK